MIFFVGILHVVVQPTKPNNMKIILFMCGPRTVINLDYMRKSPPSDNASAIVKNFVDIGFSYPSDLV